MENTQYLYLDDMIDDLAIVMNRYIKKQRKIKKLEHIRKVITQKAVGLFMLIVPTLVILYSGAFYDEVTQTTDGTALFITIPLGLYILFSKKDVFNEAEYN